MALMGKSAKRARGRPATGETPKRYFRMSDEEYAQVIEAAQCRDESVSAYIRNVLIRDSKRDSKKVLKAQ